MASVQKSSLTDSILESCSAKLPSAGDAGIISLEYLKQFEDIMPVKRYLGYYAMSQDDSLPKVETHDNELKCLISCQESNACNWYNYFSKSGKCEMYKISDNVDNGQIPTVELSPSQETVSFGYLQPK